jgi:hypothetical protein
MTSDMQMDAAAVAQRIFDEGSRVEPDRFERWLQQCPELRSMRDTHEIGVAVWARLMAPHTPFRGENFELLADHFAWFDMGNIREAYDRDAYRRSFHGLWLVQPHNEVALTDFLHRQEAPVTLPEARARIARLTGPSRPLRSLWDALLPHRVADMRETLHMLELTSALSRLPPLDPGQISLWRALTDRRHMNRPRIHLALLRGLLCALAVLSVAVLLAMAFDLGTIMRAAGQATVASQVPSGEMHAANARDAHR